MIWGIVAAVVDLGAPVTSRPQGASVTTAALAFVLFGLSDVLEVGTCGILPGWLWGLKVACGGIILAALPVARLEHFPLARPRVSLRRRVSRRRPGHPPHPENLSERCVKIESNIRLDP